MTSRLFKYFEKTPFVKLQFIELAKEIMRLIAHQNDLKHNCTMHMSQKGQLLFQLGTTRDASKPWLKQAYEQALNCYLKVTQDFQRYPLLSHYFSDIFNPATPTCVFDNNNIFGTKKACLIKTIRADERDFWRQFINSIIRSPKQQIRYDYREGGKNKYTVTGAGVYERATKKPQYTKDEKQYYSQPQSTQIVTRKMQPSLFGFSKVRRDKLVGVMLDIDDSALLSDRLMKYDGGTVNRPYDFKIKSEAEHYFQRRTQEKTLFDSGNSDEFITVCENQFTHNPYSYNEVLARIKWDINSSKIVIGSDTLEARLLAQDRARTLRARLKETTEMEYGQQFPDDYQIPMIFYLPGLPKHGEAYTPAMQQQDHNEAKRILLNQEECQQKTINDNFEFLLGLDSQILLEVLQKGTFNNIPILLHILRQGHVHIARSLLERAQNYDLSSLAKDIQSDDPAFKCVCNAQDNEFTELFLKQIKNTSVLDAALSEAFNEKRWARMCWLIGNGANSDLLFQSGKTLLHLAAYEGRLDVATLLLQNKADPNVLDNDGWTPFSHSVMYGNHEVAKFLEKNNASSELPNTKGRLSKQKLNIDIWNYLTNIKKRTDDYAPRIPLFLGYSKQQKIAAAEMFLEAVNGRVDAKFLCNYLGELGNGKLGLIIRHYSVILRHLGAFFW